MTPTRIETVKRRKRWVDVEPFPANTIYPRRVERMRKDGPGYNPAIVGSPAIADNTGLAFPEHPPETLFVLDGNHRRALAELEGRLGDEFLAELHRGLTRAERHRIRRGLNDRRTVKPGETFLQLAEEHPHGEEADICRLVEGLGWHISSEREPAGLPCPNELRWIRKHGGDGALTRAITTYERAWGMRPGSTTHSQSRVIKGLGAFWIKYGDLADQDRLVQALTRVTVDAIYVDGREIKERLTWVKTVQDGIRYALGAEYNRRNSRRKLPLE